MSFKQLRALASTSLLLHICTTAILQGAAAADVKGRAAAASLCARDSARNKLRNPGMTRIKSMIKPVQNAAACAPPLLKTVYTRRRCAIAPPPPPLTPPLAAAERMETAAEGAKGGGKCDIKGMGFSLGAAVYYFTVKRKPIFTSIFLRTVLQRRPYSLTLRPAVGWSLPPVRMRAEGTRQAGAFWWWSLPRLRRMCAAGLLWSCCGCGHDTFLGKVSTMGGVSSCGAFVCQCDPLDAINKCSQESEIIDPIMRTVHRFAASINSR
jgi:hypothetical protein